MVAAARVRTVAIALDALADTDAIWRDWLADAKRRYRIDGVDLDAELPNWRSLLQRFAEERAPVYLRPDADVAAALRRLQSAGVRIALFADVPAELVEVALPHLAIARRVDVVETGSGALARLQAQCGEHVEIVRSRDQLTSLR